MTEPQTVADVTFDRSNLPILHECEVLVVGGSFGGVATALTLARAGRQVALVEPRTYLGREVTATLRPWIALPAGIDPSSIPAVITACIDASGTVASDGEYPLHLDAVKRRLEDILLDAGVKLFYASLPVGFCIDNDRVQGLIIGNKSGRQVVKCDAVVDATVTTLGGRLAGAKFEDVPEAALFSYSVEFTGVTPFEDAVLAVPESLGVVDDRVMVHRGCCGAGHVLIEMALTLPGAETALQLTQRDLEGRQKAMEVAVYFLSHVPAFQGAHLAAVSYEPYGPQISPMTGLDPEWAVPFTSHAVEVQQDLGIALSCFAGPVAGLWCLEAARVDPTVRRLLSDPVAASLLGTSLGKALHRHWRGVAAPLRNLLDKESIAPAQGGLQVMEPEQPQRGRPYRRYAVPSAEILECYDVDVLVVGGGSSGAVAAIESARAGMRTCVVDMNPGLGGTGTYGGVDSYWVGHRGGFVASAVEWVNQVHDRLNQPRPDNLDWPVWNIEAKTQAWLEQARNSGAEVMLNVFVIGALVQSNEVRGVVAATRAGPVALLGKVTIDATGDGDVAVYAGAQHTYGSERDHATMWYSLAQFREPGRTGNNFSSAVDVSNIEDYTRALLTGRRLRWREGSCYEHGIYIAPRESRHIHGDVTLTLTDQLLHRSWPDTIYIAFSNTDVKGQVSSDWMRMGLVPPQLEIEIPYRTLLPKGLENILVVGKAVSATRDSEAAIRMQPDMENLGGVAAFAATIAIRDGRTPRTIEVQELQAQLVEVGALHHSVLTRELVVWQPTEAELEAMVDRIRGPLHAYSDMELDQIHLDRIPLVDVCCAGPSALPILERAIAQADGARRVLLAQALSLIESPAGVPTLVSAIQERLSGDQLPGISTSIRHFVRYVPDQAAMPDAAYLLYSLGMARDQRAIPVWQRVVDLLKGINEEDIWSPTQGMFHYVDAVCYGAEQLGDPRTIPILQQLHSYAPFSGRQLYSGFQDNFLDERVAYLEVVIGRALARCGSPEGLVTLINFLNDVRAMLAEHAHTHLVGVTGRDFGKDVAAWSQWLESESKTLRPMPWSEPTEPKQVWWEPILIAREKESGPRVQVHVYKPGHQRFLNVKQKE